MYMCTYIQYSNKINLLFYIEYLNQISIFKEKHTIS